MVYFTLGTPDISTVKADILDGWSIVHLSNRGNSFMGILEKGFIRYGEDNSPVVYIPPRKKIRW
jgi:hypothetical protein